MFFRLALGNVRKSLRDYTVYFVTLVLGVTVFYAFNTISGQADFLSEDTRQMVKTVAMLMGFVTVFLSFVLGFLMVYANNYLVKRRKREFGLYQLLGMRQGQVSLILVLETLLASIASLLVGLAMGVLFSQILVFVTAALFNETVTNFSFRFSPEAALFTLICFSLVFVVMLVFNLRTLHKVRLVELMGASRVNERTRVRSLPVSVVGVMLGLALIIWSYARLLKDSLPINSAEQFGGFFLTTGIVTVGTLVLFYALSGVLLHVAHAFKGSYYRGLNMFTVRQLSSRINTVSLSMGVISLILFLAITSVSSGLGICAGISDSIRRQTPYDASLSLHYGHADDKGGGGVTYQYDADALLAAHGIDLSAISSQVVKVSSHYANDVDDSDPLTIDTLSRRAGVSLPDSPLTNTYRDIPLSLISASDYNSLRRMGGLDAVDMGSDGYMVASNAGGALVRIYNDLLAARPTVSLRGRALKPVSNVVDESSASTLSNSYSSSGVFVVPDDLLADIKPTIIYVNLNYSVPKAEGDRFMSQALETLSSAKDDVGIVLGTTRTQAETTSRGSSAIISYLAIYIGFVLVIACAAILAIQQLSSASDAAPSYLLLSELGCPAKMAMGSLLTQNLTFFLLPLVVALAHSAVALSQVMTVVSLIGQGSWAIPILITAVAFVAVYGTYLMVTYFMARGIVSYRTSKARG